MSYNVQKDSGMARRHSWFHIPSGTVIGLQQGSEIEERSTRKYAQLVYSINTASTSTGETITTSAEETQYSRVVQTDGTNTYTAHAPIGSTVSASVWRAYKVDAAGSKQWADGGQFTQIATTLSGLTYNY